MKMKIFTLTLLVSKIQQTAGN